METCESIRTEFMRSYARERLGRITVKGLCAAVPQEDAALDVYDYVLGRDLRIDVLVNNAGFGDSGAFHESDWSRQRNMVQVNVVAIMQLSRLLVPHMVERWYGMVLNLSSVAKGRSPR